MFLVGRVFAGGARLSGGDCAGDGDDGQRGRAGIMIAAALLVVASVLFTFVGGLKSVLWNDLIQFCVYLGSAIAVLVFLRYAIPATNSQIIPG
jgi:Na+/pantothenate symporter